MTDEPINIAGVTKEPLFTIPTLGAGAEVSFAPRSVEELKAWLQTERDFWQWVRESPNSEHVVSAMRSRQWWADEEIANFIATYEANPEANVAHMVKAGQRIASRYQDQRALHSSSPYAQYVAELAKKDHRVAASVGTIFVGDTPQNTDRFTTMGTALAAAFLYGPGAAPDSFKAAWNETLGSMSREHENLRITAGAAADEWKFQQQEITSLHTEQRTSFDASQAGRATDFGKLIADHEKKVDDIRNAFKKDMALKSAVTYFNNKAKSHGWKTLWFSLLALGVGGGVIAAAFLIAQDVFGGAGTATPVQIGLTVVCGFLVLWLLRLLVRILLSNLHMAEDLRNRATLVQTYLALMLEGGALGDKDRAQIVSMVFRPVSDGLVRDDGAPPTLFSAIQDAATGRSGKA